jgi:hypothetical protein
MLRCLVLCCSCGYWLGCVVLCCGLSRLVLSCAILPCLVLPCLVLSCTLHLSNEDTLHLSNEDTLHLSNEDEFHLSHDHAPSFVCFLLLGVSTCLFLICSYHLFYFCLYVLHVANSKKQQRRQQKFDHSPSLFLHQQNQRNPSDMEFECFTDNDKSTEERMEETIPIVEGVKRNATFSIEYEHWPKKMKQIPTITETVATSSEVGRLIPNASMEAPPNLIVNTKDQSPKLQQPMKFEYLHHDMLAEKKEMLAFLRRRLKVYFL